MSICPACNAQPPAEEPLPSFVKRIRQFPDDGLTEYHLGDCPLVNLTAEQAAEVDRQRRELASARAQALVDARNYMLS